MTTTEKARIAAEIKAFKNTDFSDCPELTDEQLAQLQPSHYRKQARLARNPVEPQEAIRVPAMV
jgi:hypothetical protein